MIARAAMDLLNAQQTRKAIEPLVDKHPNLSLDDAYAIQLMQVEERRAKGATVKGHKIGLTAAATQRSLGVTEPDYGHLFDDMFYDEFTSISVDRLLQPRIEPEIAFVLGKRLSGPAVTPVEAINAVEFVLPA